jgi:hypothetical protein
MTRLRTSGSVLSHSSISADTVSMHFLIIQIFWNHLCTYCSHVQILCNNLVDCTLINIKFNGDHSNCHTSILKPSHSGCLCFVSQRGGDVQIAVHLPPFLTYLQSLCATKILEHIIKNHYQRLSESFCWYWHWPPLAWHRTWLHNTARDFSSPFLWCLNKTYIYTNQEWG